MVRCSQVGWFIGFVVCLGCYSSKIPQVDLSGQSWEDLEWAAQGSTVRMAMWDGDPAINAYMRNFVRQHMRQLHGIDVQFIGGHGNVLVNRMMVELDAGKSVGDIDVLWINGETFYQLRQIDALFGPFTDRLPNSQYINWNDPFIAVDFQQPVEGYECPWGNVQLAFIYDPRRITNPPQNKEELSDWVKAHPGRFTFDTQFTGMTFLKSLLYDIAGGPEAWKGPFDEGRYARESARLWDYLRDIKPYLWRGGATFPEGVAQLHQLFVNGEVDFSMSNNDGEVDNKVEQGILPEGARGYVWSTGTIRNSHYLGIPVNAPNKAGALQLINFLISPAAQLEKAKPAVWGDGTVLDSARLPPDVQPQFAEVPGRKRVASREELARFALMEPAPEITMRLQLDFRKHVIEER
jgi:putative spermidine/putrescine transport system substrate-binding protein